MDIPAVKDLKTKVTFWGLPIWLIKLINILIAFLNCILNILNLLHFKIGGKSSKKTYLSLLPLL